MSVFATILAVCCLFSVYDHARNRRATQAVVMAACFGLNTITIFWALTR